MLTSVQGVFAGSLVPTGIGPEPLGQYGRWPEITSGVQCRACCTRFHLSLLMINHLSLEEYWTWGSLLSFFPEIQALVPPGQLLYLYLKTCRKNCTGNSFFDFQWRETHPHFSLLFIFIKYVYISDNALCWPSVETCVKTSVHIKNHSN